MEPLRSPEIEVETIWRTILVTDARDSSKAYFSERAEEALIRIERDRALFAQIAAGYGGEEARDRGDGSMFAFCDPVAALRAAMTMQEEIARRNAALPEESLRLVHRMGLQMGQIKLAKTRLPGSETVRRKLSGDIVVTAARLEALCHPGEVCFSNDVHRVVRSEFEHEFRYLDATLKGFARPMRCWSTRFDREWTRPLSSEEEAAWQKRVEEKRLRKKWEREQRERHLRYLALRGAAAFAAASVLFAGFRVVQTTTGFDNRLARAWVALLTSPDDVPYGRSETVSTGFETMAAEPSSRIARVRRAPTPRPVERVAPRPASSPRQVSAVLREALNRGQFEELPARLADMRLPEDEYLAVVDDAQRVQRARDWLAVRLEPAVGDDTKGIAIEPSVAGITVLTHADERGLVGLDDADRHRTIAYTHLKPKDFGVLLKAASADGDAAPDGPEACVRSLAALRRRMEQ